MACKILVNPFPSGNEVIQRSQVRHGTIALCGSAVSTGEPLDWSNLSSGVGYNEINFIGNGVHGGDTALTTGFAISAGVCTVTAANNFAIGQVLSFVGNTQTLSALFNGVNVTVASATTTSFTFNTTTTGTTTTGDVGLAYSSGNVFSLALSGPQLTSTVTALSASGTTLTVTAANTFLPGARVVVSVATGTLGPKLALLLLPVIQSTGTAFTATMPSALTGTTGTGTAIGSNPPQPFSLRIWSALASGYTYQYNSTFGTLFVQDVIATGTNDGSTPPLFTGAAATLQKLAAAAYPAGVLADVIKFEAWWSKDR